MNPLEQKLLEMLEAAIAAGSEVFIQELQNLLATKLPAKS